MRAGLLKSIGASEAIATVFVVADHAPTHDIATDFVGVEADPSQ